MKTAKMWVWLGVVMVISAALSNRELIGMSGVIIIITSSLCIEILKQINKLIALGEEK